MFNQKTTFTLPLLVIGYVILILLWFAAWLMVGDRNWWLILLNRMTPYLFIPIPLLLAGILLASRIKLMPALLVPGLIFGGLYSSYVFPKLAQPGGSGPQLRVMTYNILFSNLDDAAIANVILTHHPDLVALQEVQPPMMAALKVRLTQAYPYAVLGDQNPFGTTAVFSRYPLSETEILNLQADRPAVVVKTKVNDRAITFISAHLLAYGLWWVDWKDIPAVVKQRTGDQNRQAELLLAEIQRHKGTVILGCDCNSYETSSSVRILGQVMNNAAREVGWTLPGNEPAQTRQDTNLQHIDYVWYRGAVEPVGAYTNTNSGGSDHLPVLAVFEMD